jgi:hypothetical protein
MNKRIFVFLMIGLFVVLALPAFAEGTWPAWQQSFQRDTAGWFAADTPGPAGWCGQITRYGLGSGPVSPSAGAGYAVVENGPCNEYWSNNGWVTSGPYAPFGGFSSSWPQSGFVSELDIYLNPGWGEGTGFVYYVSMRLLDENEFRYFSFPVTKQNGTLVAAGHQVSQAGWYTFRVRFRDAAGHLAVDFELAQKGHVLFAQAMTSTTFSGESTSSFAVADVGTGYSWFDAITTGLQLPIDQHKYRPGY